MFFCQKLVREVGELKIQLQEVQDLEQQLQQVCTTLQPHPPPPPSGHSTIQHIITEATRAATQAVTQGVWILYMVLMLPPHQEDVLRRAWTLRLCINERKPMEHTITIPFMNTSQALIL